MRYVKAALTKQSAVSAGVGALLILILTSTVIASSILQGGPAQRTATSGKVGGTSSPTNAGSHVTFSLTPTAGAKVTPSASPTPQSGPTAGSGGHHVDPGSSGNPGSGGGSPAPTPTAGPTAPPTPGATPTAGPSPTATPTVAPTPTPGLPDDAIAVGPTTPASVSVGLTSQNIALTIQNTGSNSWGPGQLYALHCSVGCDPSLISTFDGNLPDGVTVFPGQTVVIAASFYPLVRIPGVNVYHPNFTMVNNHNPFGADIPVTITFPIGPIVLQQPSPSCDNPAGVAWNLINAGGGNSVACTLSGLLMQQVSALPPEAYATTVPGYDPNAAVAYVHVHFTGSSSTTWAGLDSMQSHPSQCPASRLEVRADGAWRLLDFVVFTGQTTCSQLTIIQGQFAASSDWDLEVAISHGAGGYSINGRDVLDGGISASPNAPVGLIVEDGSGTSLPTYFSGFTIRQPATSGLVQYVLG